MSRLALILETPMSLQPEMCEHLAKDCLHAAERTEAARNAIAQAVATGHLENTKRRSYCAVSLPNILSYGSADGSSRC